MPHKRSIPYEDWILDVDRAEQPCLRIGLEEAFVAMLNARDDGADRDPGCRGIFESGTRTLERVRAGIGVKPEDVLCKGADDALRKFVEARSCRLQPRRGGRVPG